MNSIYKQYSDMSGVFLTDRIPEQLFISCDESDSFDALDDFIRDHLIQPLENVHPADIWELIESATNMNRKAKGLTL